MRDAAIRLALLGIMTVAGSVTAAAATATPPVSSYRLAQLKFNLGLSEGDARRLLYKNGYRDIRITRTSFKNVRAQACLGGIRYELKVRRLSGKVIRGRQIGRCRNTYGAQEIARRLKKQGLDKISVSAIGRGNFIASACDYDQRVRLKINAYGEVLRRSVTGQCQRRLGVGEIRRQLREDGFTRIDVVRKNQRRLIIEACFKDDRMRLRLGARGYIQRQNIIGTCARPIRPQNIARRLGELGYRRIKVIDNQLPVYQAEACKQNSLMRIRINRYGEVISESRLGQCSPRLNRRQIVKMLQQRGANRIEILSSDSTGFRAEACYRRERRQYRIDPYGVILKRRIAGRCTQVPQLDSVLKKFRSRGMRDLRILVEACRNNRRFQIEIDQYGDEISRERIGNCK